MLTCGDVSAWIENLQRGGTVLVLLLVLWRVERLFLLLVAPKRQRSSRSNGHWPEP